MLFVLSVLSVLGVLRCERGGRSLVVREDVFTCHTDSEALAPLQTTHSTCLREIRLAPWREIGTCSDWPLAVSSGFKRLAAPLTRDEFPTLI